MIGLLGRLAVVLLVAAIPAGWYLVATGDWRRIVIRWQWARICRSCGVAVRRDREARNKPGPGEKVNAFEQVEHVPQLLAVLGRPVGSFRRRLGVRVRVWAAVGQTTAELAAQADRFASTLWCRRCVIEVRSHRTALFTFLWRDPFEEARGWYPAVLGRTRPGFDIQGRAIDLPLLDAWGGSWLIGASSGAGKSSWMNALAADWVRQPPDTRILLGIDLKRVELGPWSPAFHRVARTRKDALAILAWAAAYIDARMAALEAAGLRTVPDVPTVEWSYVGVFVDELGALLNGKGEEFDEARRLLADIAMLGRAAGVLLICAAQRPTTDLIPGQLRDNLGRRVLLRVATLDQGRAVLGWMPDQATVDQLNVPGLALVDLPGREPFLARATFGDVQDVADLTQEFALAC